VCRDAHTICDSFQALERGTEDKADQKKIKYWRDLNQALPTNWTLLFTGELHVALLFLSFFLFLSSSADVNVIIPQQQQHQGRTTVSANVTVEFAKSLSAFWKKRKLILLDNFPRTCPAHSHPNLRACSCSSRS
jgi:hypothetical protein